MRAFLRRSAVTTNVRQPASGGSDRSFVDSRVARKRYAFSGVAAAAMLTLCIGACAKASQSQGRFVMAVDPGSRYDFEYVRDRESQKWVHLHCELRVLAVRELPVQIANEAEPIQFTRFMPGAMATAGISASEFEVRENYRVWLYRGVADDADFAGLSGIGVKTVWPDSTVRPRQEPMEVLPVPTLSSMKPYIWSAWATAKEFRPGQFAGWEKTNELASAITAPPEFPFELRCRPVLADVVYVPTREMDMNIEMPDPSVAR